MGNFYYRTSKAKIPQESDSDWKDKVRNNATVTLTGAGMTLPLDPSNVDEAYNPNGTGRPKAVLEEVSMELSGTAGSMRKLKASFVAFDKDSFNELENAFLKPKTEVTCKLGYAGPSTPGDEEGPHTFIVFKPKFDLTKELTYKCSFEAIGKGTDFGGIDIQGTTSKFSKLGATFNTTFKGGEEKADVQNLFDWLDHTVQKGLEQTGKGFTPGNGASKFTDGGWVGALKAPDEYNPPSKIETGWFSADYIQYVSLGLIIAGVNKHCLSGNADGYQIILDDDHKKLKTVHNGLRVWSPNPMNILFQNGGAYDDYHKSKSGPSRKFISVNSFKTKPGSIDSGPQNIIFSRDLLRSIQKAFDDDAKSENENTEENVRGKGEIRIDQLFKKLFAVIRENSGGAFDLSLEHKDEEGCNDPPLKIYIVNRKSPAKSSVTPLEIDPYSAKNGVRECTFSGDLPKSLQAAAMSGHGDSKTDTVNVGLGAEGTETKDEGQSLSQRSREARGRIDTDEYAQSSVTSAQAVVKEIVESESTETQIAENQKLEPAPYPLKLNLVIDGTGGFRFGDVISVTNLPDRYKGSNIVFTVNSYKHTVKNNDWETKIETLMRFAQA